MMAASNSYSKWRLSAKEQKQLDDETEQYKSELEGQDQGPPADLDDLVAHWKETRLVEMRKAKHDKAAIKKAAKAGADAAADADEDQRSAPAASAAGQSAAAAAASVATPPARPLPPDDGRNQSYFEAVAGDLDAIEKHFPGIREMPPMKINRDGDSGIQERPGRVAPLTDTHGWATTPGGRAWPAPPVGRAPTRLTLKAGPRPGPPGPPARAWAPASVR